MIPAAPITATNRDGVSIIIPHLNQHEALERCLASLDAQEGVDCPVQVIVVDNGSRVSLDALAARRRDVEFLVETQPGPGMARNTGVAAARHARLMFIDADCRAHHHWIVRGLVGLAGAPICGGDVQIDVANAPELTAIEAYESVFAYRQTLYIRRDGFSGTGNLATTRGIYERIGPFAGIGVAEDRDWGQRARTMGIITQYRADMIVYHPARESIEELTQKWRRHVAHDLAKHRSDGKSNARWLLLAGAVAASIIPHAFMTLRSPRLSGTRNRYAAISVLARIRVFRVAEMVRNLRAGATDHSAAWNRS